MEKWKPGKGVVEFPSGRRIRGRSWRLPVEQNATVSVILTTAAPGEFSTHSIFAGNPRRIMIDWPDYRLPRRTAQAAEQLYGAWQMADSELVEITCRGGVGRTGTALAMIAMFEGMSACEAIDFVRSRYNEQSVQSHAQRGFIMDFSFSPRTNENCA